MGFLSRIIGDSQKRAKKRIQSGSSRGPEPNIRLWKQSNWGICKQKIVMQKKTCRVLDS